MTTYICAFINVHDPEIYAKYMELGRPLFKREGVELIAADEAPMVLTPGVDCNKVVVLGFRDDGHAMQFLTMPEYVEAAKLRDAAATLKAVKFNGFDGEL